MNIGLKVYVGNSLNPASSAELGLLSGVLAKRKGIEYIQQPRGEK